MLHKLPDFLYNKRITAMLENLIVNHGIQYFSDVDELDKLMIITACMGYYDEPSYLTNNLKFNISINKLIKFMNSNSILDAVDLAHSMQEIVTQEIEDLLIVRFSELSLEIDNEKNKEAGLTQTVDSITGEKLWIKK